MGLVCFCLGSVISLFLTLLKDGSAAPAILWPGRCFILTKDELEPGAMRQYKRHGYRASAGLYPEFLGLQGDLSTRELSDSELRLLAQGMDGTGALLRRADEIRGGVDVSGDGLCVSYPYAAGERTFDSDAMPESGGRPRLRLVRGGPSSGEQPPRSSAKLGRNEPCHCGSGKKYKKCCLSRDGSDADRARAETSAARPDEVHALDRAMAERVMAYGLKRFPEKLVDKAFAAFWKLNPQNSLVVPWFCYGARFERRPLAAWFLDEAGAGLSARKRSWLEANLKAWLSLWEIVDIDKARHSLTLRDQFSGQERTVVDIALSACAERYLGLLGRVVDFEGKSHIIGCHIQPLDPRALTVAVQNLRQDFGFGEGAVPTARLTSQKFGREAIAWWESLADEQRQMRQRPVSMQNTSGDPMLWTTDHYSYDMADEKELIRRLAEFSEHDRRGDEHAFVITNDDIVLGTVSVGNAKLKIESNSVRRADALRAQVESSCGELLTFRIRDHVDVLSEAARASASKREPELLQGPEIDEMIRQQKAKFYGTWCEEQIPAIGNITPLEAVKTASGRRAVTSLLKDMIRRESQHPESQRYDFSIITNKLNLRL